MAEAILFDLAAGLISKVGSLLLNEIVLLWGVKDELDKLKRTVSTIEAVLLHAEELSVVNPQVKNWLRMLSEGMYDADDLLDEFSTEALHQQVMGGSGISKQVRLFFSSSNQIAFGLKMAHKIKALRETLDDIASEKTKFHLEERPYVQRRFVSDPTHSSPPELVIGREQEKEAIVARLLSSDYEENVSVVAIVGIGGLGKTTLAQSVYNDERVKNHFDALKMWVCVSNDFDVQLLVKKTLESAIGEKVDFAEIDILKNRLHEKINGRTYLLVLDDVWNEDVNKWSSFKSLLVGGAKGSKILITTRLRKVADLSRPISTNELRGLPDDDSWSLFKQVAFKKEQLPNPSFEAIGKEIVAKCCGVPLAIKTIGGMLNFRNLESEWILFKDKELSTIDVYKSDILPILKLSYNHLPSPHKHCFAYCSLYPKDFSIPVDNLIQLWVAQGYVKSTDLNESLRDAGFEYFMDLYRLSFFQDVEQDDTGNILHCKMHDLMHDLAVSVAEDIFSVSDIGMKSIDCKTRHVSFEVRDYSATQNFSSMSMAKKMRTALGLNRYGYEGEKIDAIFSNLRCLRVLDLSFNRMQTLPKSIYRLKHLRHLDVSHSKIKMLPNSITKLYNLQVLRLERCRNLIQLPSNITKMVNLTDLDVDGCDELSYMPRGIGKLTRLEKLSEFVIAKDESISKRSGGLDELHSMNNLRGKLKMKRLSFAKNAAFEFKEAHLGLKQKLQRLELDWYKTNRSAEDVANHEMGIEALCPHPNLKELEMNHYKGEKPPTWLPSITNLVSIKFHDFSSIQHLPPLDHLPHLKKLVVSYLRKLEHMDVHGGRSSLFFPSLTDLTLFHCRELRGFSTHDLPRFPCLSQLRIRSCPNLTLPFFPDLKKLEADGDAISWVQWNILLPFQSNSSPFSTLSQLKDLSISYMYVPLRDEFLQQLPSLQHLDISDCYSKTISGDEKDDGMQWRNLQVLRSVSFAFMRNLVALPKWLQYATTLQRLAVAYCPNLACIPEWMPNIELQELTIYDSPKLEERCENDTAEDWHKISHIPNIEIGRKQIQNNGAYLL